MIEEIRMVLANHNLVWIYISFLLIGTILFKGNRKQVFIPAVIVTIAVVNPLTYELWYRYNTRAYWRLLWVIPVLIICAAVPSYMFEKIKQIWMKIGLLIITIAMFFLCGFQVYAYENTTFGKADNPEKLPRNVVKVAETLLDLDDEPYTVADLGLSIYLRQYSGKIKTLYARNVAWGVANTEIGRKTYETLYSDLHVVAQTMLNYDYEYLVTTNDGDRESLLADAGFEKIQQVEEYGIYRANGKKTEKRIYDELHRVTSLTTIDENENPVNINGFATVEYEYDASGNIIKECYFDEDGQRTVCEAGYSLYTAEYNGDKIVRKRYYDTKDKLTDIDSGYAEIEYLYTNLGTLIYDKYSNKNGEIIAEGKYYLHEYLNNLTERNCIIFIAVNDDAANSLNSMLINDLKRLGIKTDLTNKYRNSYYAIITPQGTIEDISSNSNVSHSGEIDGITYSVSSYGYVSGIDYCSIVINGEECSQNKRGLNFVVVEEGIVTDSVAFDTSAYDTKVYR